MDFREVFSLFIKDDHINITNGVTIHVDVFQELFQSVSEPSYDAFCAVDGGVKGYNEFFDKCKNKGVLTDGR